MLNVIYDVCDLLYRILSHAPIYYSYVRHGIYYRVFQYGDDFIHVCHYYYYVSQLPF